MSYIYFERSSLTFNSSITLLQSKANSLARNEETAKKDIIRAVTAIISAGSVALFASQSAWLHSHSELAMIGIFVLG